MAKANRSKNFFDDPHALVSAESETFRVRSLPPLWRNSLILTTAITIFLCINQQFVLRFFIDFTPLNTEYYLKNFDINSNIIHFDFNNTNEKKQKLIYFNQKNNIEFENNSNNFSRQS